MQIVHGERTYADSVPLMDTNVVHLDPCQQLSRPFERAFFHSSAALQSAALEWQSCLAAASHNTSYFDVVPLLYTRLLQLRLYAHLLNITTHITKQSSTWNSRLTALTKTINPHHARSPLQQRCIDRALASYRVHGRSGLHTNKYPVPAPGDPAALAAAMFHREPPDPHASMHMHVHVTHHGGTTMGGMAAHQAQQVPWPGGGAIVNGVVGAGNSTKIEGRLLALESNITAHLLLQKYPLRNVSVKRCPTCAQEELSATRDAILIAHHNWAWLGLSALAPVDFAQFESTLPLNAPLSSNHIVWTTNIRHPSLWIANRIHSGATFGPNYFLHCWLPGASGRLGGTQCDVQRIMNMKPNGPPKACIVINQTGQVLEGRALLEKVSNPIGLVPLPEIEPIHRNASMCYCNRQKTKHEVWRSLPTWTRTRQTRGCTVASSSGPLAIQKHPHQGGRGVWRIIRRSTVTFSSMFARLTT